MIRLAALAGLLAVSTGCVVAHSNALTPAAAVQGEHVSAQGCTFWFLAMAPMASKSKAGPNGQVETWRLLEEAGGGRQLTGVSVDHFTRVYPLGLQVCTRVHAMALPTQGGAS